MKKIKFIESICLPELEKKINKLISKGWTIRGDFSRDENGTTVLLEKE